MNCTECEKEMDYDIDKAEYSCLECGKVVDDIAADYVADMEDDDSKEENLEETQGEEYIKEDD